MLIPFKIGLSIQIGEKLIKMHCKDKLDSFINTNNMHA